jgi:branched-chain amino acid transport system substrate-binding protein
LSEPIGPARNKIAPALIARARRRAPLTAAVTILALGAGGCGDQSRGGHISGDTLTIYSSLPLQGPHRAQSESIINGEKLALQEAGGKAGAYKVNFASRDDATAGDSAGPGWSPGKTADNASKAAEDSRTIAYVGELDSGASAISIPITNEAGFVQVSPAATAVGLTKLVPGADKGEPDKYYPSGDRTFARVVPADEVQASAGATWAKEMGVRKVFLIDDKSVQGQGLVEQFRIAAEGIQLELAGGKSMDPRAGDYRGLASQIADENPDLVYFGGGVEHNAARLWRDLHAAMPAARLMGSDGLLVPDFYGRVGDAAGRTYLVSATQDPSQLAAPGQRFLRDYRRVFGERGDRYAPYGHAAMALLLDAIRRAGERANQRGVLVDKVFDTSNLKSVIGTFSIDDNGDTTLDQLAGYRLRDGRPILVKALRGQARG